MAPKAPDAVDTAKIVQEQLAADPVWTVALVGASPAEPWTVMRLDRPDDRYFIVEFTKGSRIGARMAIGEEPQKLLRVNGISQADAEIPPFLSANAFIAARQGAPLGVGAARERIVRADTISVHPLLAWRPCSQSYSPLLPFYLLTVGDAVYYLRVDGKLFHRLTRGLPGR